jgi:hypothetical protein
MRVFIYEYICGGGLAGEPLPDSLAREGWAMLASVVEDFSRIDGCEVVTTLDDRFAGRLLAARWIERIPTDSEATLHDAERRVIERLAAECDWTLIIAPELDGVLLSRVKWAECVGGRLLGPSSTAVAAAADKFACGQRLERAGVPTVVGQLIRTSDRSALLPAVPFPAVLKPRDGAGSQHTFLVSDAACFDVLVRDLRSSDVDGEFLLQPFVPGKSASVSFLIGPMRRLTLLGGEQFLSSDGRFRYLGGRIPLGRDECQRAVALATCAVTAMSGLNGFVGVDLVLGQAEGLQIANCKLQIANCGVENLNDVSSLVDGNSALSTRYSVRSTPSAAVVLEINPRLTTSYVGLRRLARANLAERMLRVAAGESIEPIEWHPGTVSFSADGQVAYSEADSGKSS